MAALKLDELNEEETSELIELFKAFGDYTRVKILEYLFDVDCVCVSELASRLGMTSSAISHQLKILKQNKLVKSKRDGKQIYYSLADEHVSIIMEKAVKHITEEK